jgi:hypothetical protein
LQRGGNSVVDVGNGTTAGDVICTTETTHGATPVGSRAESSFKMEKTKTNLTDLHRTDRIDRIVPPCVPSKNAILIKLPNAINTGKGPLVACVASSSTSYATLVETDRHLIDHRHHRTDRNPVPPAVNASSTDTTLIELPVAVICQAQDRPATATKSQSSARKRRVRGHFSAAERHCRSGGRRSWNLVVVQLLTAMLLLVAGFATAAADGTGVVGAGAGAAAGMNNRTDVLQRARALSGTGSGFTPVDSAALKAAVGTCAWSNSAYVCTGGCLGETGDGSCPTFAASNDATGNPYGVMGNWDVSKVTSLDQSTSTPPSCFCCWFFHLNSVHSRLVAFVFFTFSRF